MAPPIGHGVYLFRNRYLHIYQCTFVLTIDRNIVYTIYANEKCLNVKTYLVICLVYRDAFSIVIIDVVILLTLDLKINLVSN